MLGVSFGNIMLVESMLGENLEPVAKDALKDVEKSLQRMQAMVKQFLVLANRSSEARGGMPIPSVVELKTVLNDVISNIKMQRTNSNIEFNCKCNIDENIEILFDDSHIREIFQLILNEIAETTAGKAACDISAEFSRQKSEVICKIKAQGSPHVEDASDSIFEPFALPIANVGSGLSFSVAKHLLEVNNGKIEAKFPDKETLIFELFLKTPSQE
jgi:K+-sensing histidine kinase KdpD